MLPRREIPAVSPGGYTRSTDSDAAYHLVCDGSQWNLNLTLHKDGPGGIGTADPSSGLTLDVEGKVGATEYCENCFTADGVGGGSAEAAGPEGAIQFNNSNALAGDTSFVFTRTGRVGIGTAAPANLLSVGSNANTALDDGTYAVSTSGVNLRIDSSGKYAMGIENKNTGRHGLHILAGRTAGDYVLHAQSWNGSAAQTKFAVTGSGISYFNGSKLGINTTSPPASLSIGSDTLISDGTTSVKADGVNISHVRAGLCFGDRQGPDHRKDGAVD